VNRRNAAAGGRRPHLELGDEPALCAADGLRRLDRRRVSGRWLVGTVLTGIASACLLGGALYASLDRQSRFAEAPRLTPGKGAENPTPRRKTDRLAQQSSARAASKQTLRIDTVARIGEKEYVKVRPFVRVSAPLALARTALTSNLPAFNPLRLYGDAEAPMRAAPPKPEGEVALVIRDFDDRARIAPVEPPAAELNALVRQAARGARELSTMVSAFAPADGLFGSPDAFLPALGFGAVPAYGSAVRTWTENVTLVAKSARTETASAAPDDRIVLVQRGDKLPALLAANGATPAEAQAMASILSERFPPERLRDGIRLRLTMSAAEDDRTRLRPVRASLYEGDEHKASVALSDNGVYVAIEDPGDFSADADSLAESDEDEEGPTPSLYYSLYETGLKLELPKPLVDSLVRIYSYDVDFQRRVEPGDAFEVFYSAENDKEILYAALTLKGDTRRYYRFQIPGEDGFDYFDDSGRSAKKFLMQKPMAGGALSSGFGFRRHPILGYRKMHTGVDWRAPRGTPIVASGNGTVETAGWESGYGRYVRIKHANGYATGYGHMSSFAKGVSPGAKVRQGQVIGYVGSTGQSTGNHLHYEVLINERFVNPLSIRVPRGRTLGGEALAQFKRERERIDGVMSRPPVAARM
jgi:murein DD-endopeptidase MepM/ murein hydrolase activator NlpD